MKLLKFLSPMIVLIGLMLLVNVYEQNNPSNDNNVQQRTSKTIVYKNASRSVSNPVDPNSLIVFDHNDIGVFIDPSAKRNGILYTNIINAVQVFDGNTHLKLHIVKNSKDAEIYVKEGSVNNGQEDELGVTNTEFLRRYDPEGKVIDQKLSHSTITIDNKKIQKDSTDSGLNIDLMYSFVVLHEFGHSVGLQHSNDPKSIMYPSNAYVDNFGNSYINKLSSDMIKNIDSNYLA